MAKEAASKKTMDVAKPGKSIPDSSSRPVIVSNKPQVQDPMVKADVAPPEESKSPEQPVTHGSKVIQPLDHSADTEEAPQETAETPEEKEAKEEAAVVDAVAGQADLGKKNTQAKIDADEQKKQEELDKLIAEKKYFVPVGQVAHRRNQRTVMVLILLIVVAAALYAAVDAELLDVGIELPFDFIKS